MKKRIDSFGYAFRGIGELIRTQPNARIHLLATLGVVAAAFWFELSRGEWLAVILAMGGVWAAEAFNTALEALTDLASPEYHELARRTKDVAAGGVLLMAIAAAAVGLVVFLPRLSGFFS